MDLWNLQEAVRKVVEEHLPSQITGALKDYFDEHERLVSEHEKLEKEFDAVKRANKQLSESLNAHGSLGRREEVLKKFEGRLEERKTIIADRERLADVTELKIRLIAAELYGSNVTTFMLNLSRNTVTKKKFCGDVLVSDVSRCEPNSGSSRETQRVETMSHATEVEDGTPEPEDES